MMEFISSSEEETKKFAIKIGKQFSPEVPLFLFGDMGAGKTIFVKGLAESKGGDSFKVKSPTYTLVWEHELKKYRLAHFDLYRLEKEVNLENIGMEEYLDCPETLVVVEWAERMQKNLPTKRIEIFFEKQNKNRRKIIVKKFN